MAFSTNNFQKGKRTRKPVINDINITPFVDVLLVLLIIFMVAAPMMTAGVEINLPKGVENDFSQTQDPVYVTVKDNGDIYLDADNVKLREIPGKLLEKTNNNISGKIFVRGDSDLDYGRIMNVVKIINAAGFTQVVLVTQVN